MYECEDDPAGERASCGRDQIAQDPHDAIRQTVLPEAGAQCGEARGDEAHDDHRDLVDAVAEVDRCGRGELHEDPPQDGADARSRESLADHEGLPPAKGKGLILEAGGESGDGHAVTYFRGCCAGCSGGQSVECEPDERDDGAVDGPQDHERCPIVASFLCFLPDVGAEAGQTAADDGQERDFVPQYGHGGHGAGHAVAQEERHDGSADEREVHELGDVPPHLVVHEGLPAGGEYGLAATLCTHLVQPLSVSGAVSDPRRNAFGVKREVGCAHVKLSFRLCGLGAQPETERTYSDADEDGADEREQDTASVLSLILDVHVQGEAEYEFDDGEPPNEWDAESDVGTGDSPEDGGEEQAAALVFGLLLSCCHTVLRSCWAQKSCSSS